MKPMTDFITSSQTKSTRCGHWRKYPKGFGKTNFLGLRSNITGAKILGLHVIKQW